MIVRTRLKTRNFNPHEDGTVFSADNANLLCRKNIEPIHLRSSIIKLHFEGQDMPNHLASAQHYVGHLIFSCMLLGVVG